MNARVKLAKMKATQAAAAFRRRAKTTTTEHKLIRQGSGIAAAAVLGTMQRNGVSAGMGGGAGSAGVPWKPLLGTVLFIGSAFTKGAVSAALEGASIGANAVYTARAVETGTLVAGGEV